MGLINWWRKRQRIKQARENTRITLQIKRQIPKACDFCSKGFTLLNFKQCKYCGGYYYMQHLQPAEEHKCKGKLKRSKDLVQGTSESLGHI